MRFWGKKTKPQAEVAPKAKEPEFSTSPELQEIGSEMAKARAEMISSRTVQRKAPTPNGTAGTAMDSVGPGQVGLGGMDYVNQVVLSYYAASSSFIGYFAMAIIGQHWLVIKGNTMAVKNAVKKWYDISVNDGTPLDSDQIKYIEKMDKAYRLKQNMIQAVHMRNQFGIRHVLYKHTNPNFDYSQPFNPDSWGVGEYAGISQIDPYWIVPEIDDEDLTDPTRIGFYEPTFWVVNGRRYHKSHFVILYGAEVSDYLKPTYRYGGISKNQQAYERIYAAERTANEAPQLAMTKRQFVQSVKSLPAVQAGKSAITEKIKNSVDYMNNYGRLIIGADETMSKFETSLSDLTDVINNQFQLIAAIYGEPVSAFMSTEMGGFSSGETEENFSLSNVEELQGNDLREIADAHYARLVPTMIKPKMKIDPEIEMSWRPLKVMSAKERAETNNLNANTDSILDSLGYIDKIDGAKRLINDPDSGYSGMELPIDFDCEDEDVDLDIDDNADVEQSDSDLKDSSLNGAQVTSLAGVASQVATGQLTLEQGIEIIITAFNGVDRERAKTILGNGIQNDDAEKVKLDGES